MWRRTTVAVLAAACLASAGSGQWTPPPAGSLDDLDLALELVESARGAQLEVTLENRGSETRQVRLGSLATKWDDLEVLPDHLHVELVTGADDRYRLFFSPLWRNCNCRPFDVVLPPGAAYRLVLSLAELHWVMGEQRGDDDLEFLPRGPVVVTVTLDPPAPPGAPRRPLASNALVIELDELRTSR